ncbi:tail tape measure protein [Cereibacter sphaeroides]|uniref:tail tape measure protein n=1 Tax=Cereibacter sphaeroides TaxID=1063 RepID=UPI000F54BD06|nr:tail tape measure protein [Cereibacter sphaeroides]AZB65041.1 tail tape measure protein [Cereibacter sphaeroides]AZB67075.1 tail tape measure protein [Cereibacter sphaeroides]
MSGAVIGALRVNLGLDSAQFQQGLKNAQSSLGAAAKAFGALSAIGATVGAAMTGIVVPTARAANEISRLAQVANTTPQTLQRWSAASKSVGIEQEKLADILKDVNDKVGDFLSTGGGEMKDFFEKIAPKVGVTAKEFRNLSGPQALQLYVSSLEKAGVSQAQMTFYMEAIANDATLLLPLLRNNGAEMERLGDQAADLGAILSDEAVASLRDAHLALGQMATAVSAARDRIAAELAPAVEAMAVAFTDSMREGGLLRGVIDGIGAVAGAVADNIDRLAVYTATAAAALAVSMTPALIAATRAAWAFVAGLVATRAALIRTGLGIAVVAVGELAYQLLELTRKLGGVGNAFKALKDVAVEVWKRIALAANVIPLAVQSVSDSATASWLRMLNVLRTNWADFLSWMAGSMRTIGANEIASNLDNSASAAVAASKAMGELADNYAGAAAQGREHAQAILGAAMAPLASLDALNGVVDEANSEMGDLSDSTRDAAGGAGDLGSAAGGAKKKLSDLVNAAKEWKERLKTPVQKYREEIAKLGELLKKGLLSADEYQRAIGELNKDLGDGIPLINDVATAWGDFVAGGFRDFKGFVSNVLGSFKSMLAEMIATAARNRIVIGMGLGGGGLAGTAAAAGVPGMGGGGLGMLGSLFGGGGGGGFLGGIGNAFSAFGSGALGSLGNFFSGGLSGGFAYIGQSLSMASGSLVGLAQAAGAILGPIAAVAAAVSFFGTKTKLLDAGLRVTVRELNAMVETYKKVEKSRFGGLSKSRSTSYGLADGEVAGPIVEAVSQMQRSVLDVADTLGIGAEAFKGFAASVRFSTKGLSDEEIGTKLQEKLAELGDSFAARAFGYVGKNDQAIKDLEKRIAEGTSDAVVSGLKGSIGAKILSAFFGRKMQGDLADLIADNTLVSTRPELAALVKEGESFVEALQRLSAAMTGVNGVMDTLGHSFRAVDMVTAGMASDLAALFGGLDGLVSATSGYYQAFYSEAERMETATRQATEALAKMGVALPKTRAEYRRLVEAQDLTTERGRELYAALVGMAGVMDQILPSVAGLSAELAGLVGTISTDLDGMIAEAGKAQSAAAAAAKGWYQVTLSLRDYIGDLRSAASELISPAVAAAQSQARYQTMLASAMAGDQDAAKAVSGAASAYIDAVRGQARSAVDVARAQARVLSDLQLLQGVTGLEGAKEDVLASLYQEQVDLLTEVRDYLTGGEALKPEQITALNAQLGSLEGAIAAAKEISYAALRERIDVTVGLLATADIPADLRRILKNATSGVEVSLDMVLRRMDLSPDLVWIAAKASSDHLARITYLAKTDALPDDLRAIAAVRVAQSVRRLALVMDRPASDLGMAELLKALGAKGGKITLGGSFAFDPSTGFSTWFETTTRTTLTAPMGALRTALDDLRDAILAQERAAGQRERGAALSAFAGGLTTNAAGDILATDKQIMAMAAKAGISTDGKTIGQVMRAIEGFSTLDGIESIKRLPGSLTDYLRSVYVARKGNIPLDEADYLRLYPDVAADEYGYDPKIHYRNHGRREILAGNRPFKPDVFDWSAIGLDVPGFATGGLHGGGLRLVGELGPELEATGPSRIHSAGQTADILGGAAMGASEVAGAVRDLQAELVALRAENAQIARELAEMKVWARKGAEASTATAKDLRRIGTVGVRIDPTEAV